MITLAVLQHTDAEYLGLLEDHLEGRNIRFRYHRLHTPGGSLPAAPEDFAGLVVLGAGPRGFASGERLPGIAAEVRLIEAFLAAGRPVLGFGLGSVLLAAAAGGGGEAAPLRFEVGAARRVDAAALAGQLPAHYPYALYMRDRPLLPAASRVLAVDAARGNPLLFEVAATGFGFPAHPGFKRAMVEDLVMEFAEAPEDAAAGLARMAGAQRGIAEALSAMMVGLVQVARLMPPAAPA